jgi:hypothetical protein
MNCVVDMVVPTLAKTNRHRKTRLDLLGRATYSPAMLLDRLDVSTEEFQQLTGWEIKPEGACQGEICVPLPLGPFDLAATAERLGMAIVEDPVQQVWALGPETLTGRALSSTDTGGFSLPDLDGNEFELSSLRGQKVLLVAWAPY